MKAAHITPMDFLCRWQGLMSRDDAHEHLQEMMQKQMQVDVDFENFNYDTFVTLSENILGIRIISFGYIDDKLIHIPVIGMMAGGDWQQPVYMFLYLDDALQFKVYVPKLGNPYNWDTNIALGDDEDADAIFFEKIVTRLGLNLSDFKSNIEDHDIETLSELIEDITSMEHEFVTDIEVVLLRTTNEMLGA